MISVVFIGNGGVKIWVLFPKIVIRVHRWLVSCGGMRRRAIWHRRHRSCSRHQCKPRSHPCYPAGALAQAPFCKLEKNALQIFHKYSSKKFQKSNRCRCPATFGGRRVSWQRVICLIFCKLEISSRYKQLNRILLVTRPVLLKIPYRIWRYSRQWRHITSDQSNISFSSRFGLFDFFQIQTENGVWHVKT